MSGSLFDRHGVRKYLTARERCAFVCAAHREGGEVATFCLTLAFTGARISELLALTRDRVDVANGSIAFETLKRRRRGVFRVLPVPPMLLATLRRTHKLDAPNHDPKARLWKWGRTTAWKRVKHIMKRAKVGNIQAMPKAARHGFGVDAIQNSVALNVVQRWMGHARIETTAIYADVIGKEERALAKRTWKSLEAGLRRAECAYSGNMST
ncbi:MAG: site-specific integrase [Rhizomicrobium sp.]